MKIIVSGGTGFIGRSLIPALLTLGNEITVISRNDEKAKRLYSHPVTILSWEQLNNILPDTFDVVINLAGENIADARWSEKRKTILKSSRISATQKISLWLSRSGNKKQHLYNASAIGIYGTKSSFNDSITERFTESTILPTNPSDFSSELVRAWEAAAAPAINANIPVTFLRFGVVLKRHEGILKKLEPQFYLGLGSSIGSGNQPFSWIHIDDLIKAIILLIQTPSITGPVNICSPGCVSQKVFAATLAKTMHRPLFMALPAFIIKSLFGQMGEELLLSGQDVYPGLLDKNDFKFTYPTIASALNHEWKTSNKT